MTEYINDAINDNVQKCLNHLQSYSAELSKDVLNFTKVIDNEKSHTTNSMYTILEAENGDIYQLGISDHYANSHSHSFESLRIALGDDDLSERIQTTLVKRFIGISDESFEEYTWYGFDKAFKYDDSIIKDTFNFNSGKEMYSYELSKAGQLSKIIGAHLSNENQILNVEYQTADVFELKNEEKYTNFYPTIVDDVTAVFTYWKSIREPNPRDEFYNEYEAAKPEFDGWHRLDVDGGYYIYNDDDPDLKFSSSDDIVDEINGVYIIGPGY